MRIPHNDTRALLFGMLLLPLAFILFVGGFAGIVSTAANSHDIQRTRATATANAHADQLVRERERRLENLPVSFSEQVLPILQGNCVHCHGPNSIAGSPPNGLQLNNYDNVMLGSNFLPVVVPGEPENSSLILLLRSGGMPAQADPLPQHQIDLIARWIEQGAKDN